MDHFLPCVSADINMSKTSAALLVQPRWDPLSEDYLLVSFAATWLCLQYLGIHGANTCRYAMWASNMWWNLALFI